MVRETEPDDWPDVQMDQQAWLKARSEFPNAPLSVVAARAQEIKEAGASRAQPESRKTDVLGNDKGS
jgi:hypothetical protein